MSEPKRLSRTHRHGHVGHNPTGAMARCMGPPWCAGCRDELQQEAGNRYGEWLDGAAAVKQDAPEEARLWSRRTAELVRELGKTSSALRDLVEDMRQFMPALIYGTALYESFTRAVKLMLMDEGKGG